MRIRRIFYHFDSWLATRFGLILYLHRDQRANPRATLPRPVDSTRTRKLLIGILSFIAILCLQHAPVAASPDSARPNQTLPPVISVSPNQAYNFQATTITISGTDFVATPIVTLGNVLLTNVTFINSTTLTATVPADLPGGAYTLTVTNPDSQSASLASAFTVLMSGDGSLGTWQATKPMTTQRQYFNAVAVRGSLYALGGVNGSLPLNTVERAVINTDGTLQIWQMVNSMITGREAPATVVTGNYIYTLGGNDNSVERVIVNPDGTLGAWEAMSSMPSTRNYVAAVVTQGHLYALGGDSGGPLDIVERAAINADGSLGAWQAANPMTTKRRSLAAVVVGGFIIGVNLSTTSFHALVD